MKTFVGIEVNSVVRVVAVTPSQGLVDRSTRELPAREPARSAAISGAIHEALFHLSRHPSACEAVGLALSPPDDGTRASVEHEGTALMTLPVVGGAPVLFIDYEPSALFPLYAPGAGRTWLMLDDRARVYTEGAAYGETLSLRDEGGTQRRVAWAECTEVLEPVRALLYRLGIFESLDELERTAGVIEDSAGVRVVERAAARDTARAGEDEGVIVWGLTHGVRRPQVALAALESLGCAVRNHVADLAGEGAVTELGITGAYAQSDALLRVVSNMTGMVLVRPALPEAVAYGAAMRAAAAAGEILPRLDRQRFNPALPAARRDQLFARWSEARGV